MSLINKALYDSLRQVGVSDTLATEAAEPLGGAVLKEIQALKTGQNDLLQAIQTLQHGLYETKAELKVHRFFLATVLALNLVIVGQLFFG